MAGLGRVLHFVSSASRRGAERMVLNLCKATPELQPAVWFPREGPMIEEFRRAGIPCLDTKEVLGRPDATRAKFGLLHIHCGTYEPAAHRAARRLGIPSIATLHCNVRLPELDCPLVCVAAHTAAIQDALNRVRVIPNAVDTAEFAPARKAAGEKTILMRVCRPDRSAPWFWEAMRKVLARNPQAELWIVGEEAEPREQTRFFGSRSDVADLLRQADVFVYAPLPGDGSHDMCVLEALASGLPVVATDVEAVRESVRSGEDGLLAPFGNVDAFAGAVEELVRNKHRRTQMAGDARAGAERRFSLARLAEDYRAAYRDAQEEPAAAAQDTIRRDMRLFVANRMRVAGFARGLVLLNDTLSATPLAGRYWVIGGLLIGWAREGGILPHDCQDADFGVLEEDREALTASFPALARAGFELFAEYTDHRGVVVEYSFRREQARFDFFLHERHGGHLRSAFFGISGGSNPQPIELVSEIAEYGLGKMEFLGRTWQKPADHEAFLTAEYGDWRTPRPGFDHRLDSPSVVVIRWA